MPTFELKRLNQVNGKIQFYKLKADQHCLFDEFCEEIRSTANFFKQIKTIFAIMDDLADNVSLPDKKFKNITPERELVKEYEIKTRDLGVYLIKDPKGCIIITGGKKNSQKNDIKRFRSLKRTYLNN